ncbi:folylpolyglutamate synthase-like protein [Phanerochaete sordida]|uniref:Folylpolyglutamate synthase-like protein n=1 Tax=Phanerochaete sordida TaxID=48140 RepID=A0A9P3G3E8_9APHY|nr:folylpolyglutamate synthase-like protein [Phanerochaete sordida]
MSGRIDLSLDRIGELLTHLPTYTRPTCHIAGTNGKGSVSALLSSILSASSYSVGRFNSPHLAVVHDCITINDEAVLPSIYESTRKRVEATDREHGLNCSNFELLTATALVIFEEANVDIVVLEVGMGGRLDATNVIPDGCVLVSALTTVDLDHQSFLGTTVRDIAREKAAIARAGTPFVLGPQNPEHSAEVEAVARAVVEGVGASLVPAILPSARDRGSTLEGQLSTPTALKPSAFHSADGGTPFAQPVTFALPGIPDNPDFINALLPLQGEHQLDNLGTAVTMVSVLLDTPHPLDFKHRITAASISQGIQATRWRGRLSFHTIQLPLSDTPPRTAPTHEFVVLADGAHNAAASARLASFIGDALTAVTRPLQPPSPTLAARGPMEPAATPQPRDTPRRTLSLTYVLALSHSPPKTPLETLTPLLALDTPALGAHVRVITRVALPRFTPPHDMPWVASERPSALRDVVRALLPGAEVWTPEHEDRDVGGPQLRAALNWAAENHLRDAEADGGEGEGFIVIAGSLYLVADFYRVLSTAETGGP